ncbi:MAG: hypothetical protein JXB17_02600 [Bacteroidales bacterium]|nr:hypothetical protein [Bacteroidales bacterium]
MDYTEVLKKLKPEKDFFIGVDSDGCAFDTMEIKQKECFCPNFIKYFELQRISKYAREVWEFVNLYSRTRGTNRFNALVESVRLINERKEVKDRNFKAVNLKPLIDWIAKESKLGNPALEKYAAQINDPVIDLTLKWSKAVNEDIEKMVFGMPPFPFVVESLGKMQEMADIIVVSQTPLEALVREWKENNMEKYVRLIAGQENGTKAEHLAYAAKGKYSDDKILMIGDAPGDYYAAKKNGILFFPVNPGNEEKSWVRLFHEGLEKFFKGTYKGDYEISLIKEFEEFLPENPWWKVK